MFLLCDAALFLLVLILVCFDRYILSSIVYAAAIGFAIYAFSGVGTFLSSVGIWGIGYGILGYLLIGFVVCFFRWGFYMSDFGKWLKERVAKFNSHWINEFKLGSNEADFVERVLDNKKRIRSQQTLAQKQMHPIMDDPVAKRIAFLKSLKEGSQYHEVRRGQFKSAEQSEIYSYDWKMLNAAQTDEAMIDALAPRAMNHKALITFWVLHWPYEIVSLFIKNFVINLIENFIDLFGNAFTRIGKYFVRRATADLKL